MVSQRTERWRLPALYLADFLAVLFAMGFFYLLLYRARYFPELSYDESAAVLGLSLLDGHFGNHIDPAGSNDYTRYIVMDCTPPVYYMAQAVIFKLFGFGIVQARAATASFMAATSLLCYIAGRRYVTPAAGFAGMFVYIYLVPVYTYVQPVARPDAPVPFFLLLSFLLLLETRVRNDIRWHTAAGISFSLGVLSHFLGLMAGPMFFVLTVWLAGVRFFISRNFWGYWIGFLVPLLLYVWLLHPYEHVTFNALFLYGKSYGSALIPQSLSEVWPFSTSLRHIELLSAYYPIILYSFPLVSLAGIVVGWRRFPPLTIVTCATVALFILVGSYPNIATYSFYGKLYLSFGAVMVGLLFGELFRRLGRYGTTVATFLALGFMLFGLSELRAAVQKDIASVRSVPVEASLDWTYAFPDHMADYSFGFAHWVFSAAGDRLMTPNMIAVDREGYRFRKEYMDIAPDRIPFDRYKTMILDIWNQRIFVHISQQVAYLRHLRAKLKVGTAQSANEVEKDQHRRSVLVGLGMTMPDVHIDSGGMQERIDAILASYEKYYLPQYSYAVERFSPSGLMWDEFHLSGNFVIYRRMDEGNTNDRWPRVALAGPDGPIEQTIDEQCVASVERDLEMAPVTSADYLWEFTSDFTIPVELEENLIVVRAVVENKEADADRVAGYVSIGPAELGGDFLRGGAVRLEPPYITSHLAVAPLGFKGSAGERMTTLLYRRSSGQLGEMLGVYSFAPGIVKRIEFGVAMREREVCDASRQEALRSMVS